MSNLSLDSVVVTVHTGSSPSDDSYSPLTSSVIDTTGTEDNNGLSQTAGNGTSIPDTEESLGDQIRKALVASTWPEAKSFLPDNKLATIITPDNILPGFKTTLDKNSRLALEEIFLGSGKLRLFAILSMLDKERTIFKLIEEGIDDDDLPFFFDTENTYLCRRNGRAEAERILSLQDKGEWPHHFLDMFEIYQWQVLSPCLRLSSQENPRVEDYYWPINTILPFIRYPHLENHGAVEVYGGFSDVRKVKIHQAHCNLNQETNSFYAVKILRPRGHNSMPLDEATSLKRFVDNGHENLIKLLLTFQLGDQIHLVFPWADGNLMNLWEDIYPDVNDTPRDYQLAKWIAREVRGIADGLKMIHNSVVCKDNKQGLREDHDKIFGRHGDIKPENILWFRDMGDKTASSYPTGVLKISDFGLSEFHSQDSIQVTASSVGRTDTYRAPECDTWEKISPAYDMWSLGCVLLQLVSWYMRGWAGIDDFARERVKDSTEEPAPMDTFYNIGRLRSEIRAQGRSWVITYGKPRAMEKLSVIKVSTSSTSKRVVTFSKLRRY
ncbi:kinase-like protein [Thozetella sp. PMI_491]|nr:kinase-like protein [Thozetella sp. PMI_491]